MNTWPFIHVFFLCRSRFALKASTLASLEAAEETVRPDTGRCELVWLDEELALLEAIADEECRKRPDAPDSPDQGTSLGVDPTIASPILRKEHQLVSF
jgi:hypothetical protein